MFGVFHRRTLCDSQVPKARLTVALTALVIVAMVTPGVQDALELDRKAVLAGEFWRLFTGHLTHWSLDHFLWDAAVFVGLGVLCETISRNRFGVCLITSISLASVAFWLRHPELTAYRGLSGVDSALFGLALGLLWAAANRRGDQRFVVMLAAAAVLFVLKVGCEMRFISFFFVRTPSTTMVPVPIVHAVGFAVGLVTAIMPAPRASYLLLTRPHPIGSPSGVQSRLATQAAEARM